MGGTFSASRHSQNDGSDGDGPSTSTSPKTSFHSPNTNDHSRKGGGGGGRKRRHSSDPSSSSSFSATGPDGKRQLFTLDTPRYVYEKLFLGGQDSDVALTSVCAGRGRRTWHLHRVYLEQCEYFRALFGGSAGKWSDSNRKEYTLEIVDKNIDFEGLENVLASLYNNEIEIDSEHIAGVVGAAAMLNLSSVLDRCSDILSTYFSEESVLLCLELADTYGFAEKLQQALDYMKHSFWRCCLKSSFLRKLSPYWFSKILTACSDTLCLKENEMDLYIAMRNWIYLQHNNTAAEEGAAAPVDEEPEEQKLRDFFASDAYQWVNYIDVLRHLRVQHLILLSSSLRIVRRDGMVPGEIIDAAMKNAWTNLLLNEEAMAPLEEVMDDSFFYSHCIRLGRTGISGYDKTMWRWLGYGGGTDLLMNYFAGTLRLTRNCVAIPTQQRMSVRMCEVVRLHYRLIVTTDQGQVLLDTLKSTGILRADRSLEVGSFKVPKGTFSVHLFYLCSIPGPSSHHYWDSLFNEKQEEEK